MIPRSPILRLGALFEYLYGKFLLDFYECRVDNFSKSWLNSYLKMYVKRKEVESNLIQKVFLFKRRRQIDRLPIFCTELYDREEFCVSIGPAIFLIALEI